MIYLFDKDENLIKIVRKTAVKTTLQTYFLTTEKYVSDRLAVEMKALSDDELERVEYMAIQAVDDTHNFHFFYVAQKHSEGKLTELIGVQSGIEELRKTPVYDKRPKNAFAREVIADLLAGTNWSARFVGETLPKSTNFYYTSVFDALKKVCQVWDLEMQFFVQMHGNQIGARVIDFKKQIGAAVGKRVVYGHNALKILQEVERTNIYTALVGRGKGEQVASAGAEGRQADGYSRKITFEDVVWSRASGKPVDKPKGQKYVELPEMTARYGIRQANGTMRPKIGFIEFSEEDDKEVVLQKTYEALVDTSRPQVTFKTSAVYLKGVAIGDTIRVVRHDKRIDYDTRIFELTVNRLDNQSSDIKLGDRITESQSSRAQTIADKAVEEFVANEFSTFVQNLPDYLPSADGFNNNWYGAEDPTVAYKGKVVINDIWYRPDPEHEGHKIMLRWTGEAWEELVRTYDTEAVRRQVEAAQTKANQVADQARQALTKAGASETLAQTAKQAADRAKTDAAAALTRAEAVKREAIAEAQRLDTVLRTDTESRLATAKTELLGKTEQLQTELDMAKRSITSQARDILTQAQAQQDLTSRVQTVETTANGTRTTVTELTKTVNTATGNLANVTQRVASTETSLAGMRDRYTQISQTVSEQTGQITAINRQTADLQSGLDGTKASLKSIWVGDRNLLADTEKMSDQDPKRNASGSLATMFGRAVKRVLVPANSAERAEGYRKALAVALYGDKEIIVSFYAKAHARGQVIRCQLLDNRNIIKLAETSTGHTNEASDGLVEFPVTNGWLRYWVRYTFKQPCYDAPTVIIGSLGGDVSASERWVEVNSPAVYYGHHNREWSPSDVDIKTDWANYQQSVNQNLAELGGQIRTTNGSLSELRTSVNQTKDSIKLLASKTDVDAVAGRLATAESSIRLQADQISQRVKSSDFDQAKQRLSTAESTIRQTATGQEQLATRLTETQGKVASAETKITQLVGEVASKVSQIDFDRVKNRVDSQQTAIAQNSSAIALKAEKTYVDGVKATADSAKAIADGLKTTSATKAELKVVSDGISQLATKTEVNAVTGRLSTAEASIKTQADQISQRLTSTEVDSLVANKGYQTKADVDKNITGRGYLTSSALAGYVASTTFDNYKRETAQTIERGLTETKALIPATSSSVNLVADSKINLSSSDYGFAGRQVRLEAGKTYWFSARAKKTGGTSDKRTKVYIHTSSWNDSLHLEFNATAYEIKSVKFTARYTENYAISSYWFPKGGDRSGTADIDWYMVVQSDLEPTEWSPAPQDLVSTVDFNTVKETARLYERVLGRTEDDVTANIARQVMTSELYQTEVTRQQTDSELLSRLADGVPMTGNKHFATDLAGYNVYDNARTGHVTISRVADQLSPSGYAMMVRTSGSGTSPWLGGFRHEVTTAKNKEFLVRLVAKIPAGRKLYFHNNSLGTGASWRWLSSVDGTGSYATYVAYVKSGYEGPFSSFGFWAIGGGATPTASSPLVWYVSDYQVYDITNSRTEALTTRVTQIAGNYAIQNLNSNGDVLSALKLATGGASIQVGQNKLVVTPETTFIQNGTIKNAMIESVNAGKVTAGTLDAANVNIVNLNANKLVGLDADFIKAKIETALVGWLQGKVISAQNDAMRINLNQANVSFNRDATIDFNSAQNALKRVRGGVTGFVQFSDDPQGGVYANFGVSSHNVGLRYDVDFGKFAGLRVQRASDGYDNVKVYGDTIDLRHGTAGRAYVFRPTRLQKNIDINSVINMVLSLAQCFKHIKGNGWDLSRSNVQAALADEIDTFMTTIDTYKQNRIHRG